MTQDNLDNITSVASKVQYTGAGIATFAAFVNQYAALIGVIIGLAGFFVNWYYKHKAHKLFIKKFLSPDMASAVEEAEKITNS